MSTVDTVNRQAYFDEQYEKAGETVEEEENQISLTTHSHLLSDRVACVLEEVLLENPIPFVLQDFQKLALHAIGSLKNVVLVSPTGSGKMIISCLAIPVLQKVLGIPDGVAVGCQPLSAIMEEKLKKSHIYTGTISMKGGLKTSEMSAEDEDDVALSAPVEEFKSGAVKMIIGHAESWITNTAEDILESLQQRRLILFTFLDEAHIPLEHHWDMFRPKLKAVPGMLRGRAVRGSPTLAMTATLTEEEEKKLLKCLGLRSDNTVVLRSNAIQAHHKFVR